MSTPIVSWRPGAAALGCLLLAACGGGDAPRDGASAPEAAAERFISIAPDVRADGPFAVSDAIRYRSAPILVSDGDSGAFYNADVEGQLRYPLDGEGPFPVVLYQHGRHSTCTYLGGVEFLSAGVCPDFSETGLPLVLTAPIDSFEGYDYMASRLAAHGYVVLSIDANDVNDKDIAGDAGVMARSQLILHHLDIFRAINREGRYDQLADIDALLPDPERFAVLQGRMDLTRVGLMGHSRGGQGVTQAIHYNKQAQRTTTEAGLPPRVLEPPFTDPHAIEAVFALAPTNFDYVTAPDTVYAVLLPYCDGDVSNLQGAFIYDDSRAIDEAEPSPKFQILAKGGNHNYYNTMWTGVEGDGDDYTNADPWCDRAAEGNGRDSPADQRAHGEFLMSAFFRHFVGGEPGFADYWAGRAHLPAAACPEGAEGFCDESVLLSVQAPAGDRLVVADTRTPASASVNRLGGEVAASGFDRFEHCSTRDAQGRVDADGCPSVRTWSNSGQLFLQWSAPGGVLRSELDGIDASAFTYLDLRAGVAVDAEGTLATDDVDFRIRLRDSAGGQAAVRASRYGDALFLPPGDPANGEGAKTTLNMIRVPVSAFGGVDLKALQAVEIVTDVTPQGAVQITDLQFQR